MKIAIGSSVKAKKWINQDTTWDKFAKKCAKHNVRACTRAEFDNMSQDEQFRLKDVGGFVGGELLNGVRKKENVISRSIITLDIDHAEANILNVFEGVEFNSFVYSTFKSLPTQGRYRLVIELTRAVTAKEYEPLARKVASDLGILDMVDPASFRAHQLMFWPACPKDIVPFYKRIDGLCTLDPDTVLEDVDISDPATWLRGKDEAALRASSTDKLGDPTKKPYPIGAFCKAYDIHEAIEKFIPDVYERVDETRYHLIGADASAGAKTYDDMFMFSHHAHDAVGNREVNAFDLIRIHKFGDLDKGISDKTKVTELPSYKAMCELCAKDEKVIQIKCADDFGEFAEEEKENVTGVLKLLDINTKNGKVNNSINNINTILVHDKNLSSIRFNSFARSIAVTGSLPWGHKGETWSDTDLASLCVYIAKTYGLNVTTSAAYTVLQAVVNERQFHPIKDYLDSLKWDGQKRVERFFIEHLGVENNELNRAMARKFFIAAISRIMEPGIKFDQILVVVGNQGIGKSTIFKKLFGDYFSDSLSISDMKDKTGAEKLQGVWGMEISELNGMNRTETDSVKSFASTTTDRFRRAYGRATESYPRQCVIVGTTNEEDGFLRDTTGNRRFWVMNAKGGVDPSKWALEVDQVWAEALYLYKYCKEPLYLEGELYRQAEEIQRKSIESDEREGLVAKFLSRTLPIDWDTYELNKRRAWLAGEPLSSNGVVDRKVVCILEIWCECFGKNAADLNKKESINIARMLQKLGWAKFTGNSKHIKRIKNYGVQKCYERTSDFVAVVEPEKSEFELLQ